MRIRLLVAGVLLGGLASLAWTENSHALLIDDFSTDQTVSVIAILGSANSQVSGSGILGGERDMEVTLEFDVGVIMAASGDALTYLHAGNSLGTARIVWDGPDGDPTLDPTGLGGIDFTDGGMEDKIAVPLVSNDLPVWITLMAYTDGTRYSTATLLLPGGSPPAPPTRPSVLFNDFAVGAGASGGADFTDIGAFSLFIDGSSTPGLTVVLDSVVPEPSTGTLLLFGILMLASIRRYRWVP